MNRELPDVQAGFIKLIRRDTTLDLSQKAKKRFKLVLEKAEEPDSKLPTSVGPSKKQKSSTKTSISVLLTMPKPLTVWITINCGQF